MVENMDSPTIIEDDRDLEELMNMSMVTDRQNLMIQSIASSVVSSCVSDKARKKDVELDFRPMSAISAVSSLN